MTVATQLILKESLRSWQSLS